MTKKNLNNNSDAPGGSDIDVDPIDIESDDTLRHDNDNQSGSGPATSSTAANTTEVVIAANENHLTAGFESGGEGAVADNRGNGQQVTGAGEKRPRPPSTGSSESGPSAADILRYQAEGITLTTPFEPIDVKAHARLSVTLPLSAFKSGCDSDEKFFAFETVNEQKKGALALYSLLPALGYAQTFGSSWNDNNLEKTNKKARKEGGSKSTESVHVRVLKRGEREDTKKNKRFLRVSGAPRSICLLEPVLNSVGELAGVRVHAIALDDAYDPKGLLKQLIKTNMTSWAGMKGDAKKKEVPLGLQFRHEFKSEASVIDAYKSVKGVDVPRESELFEVLGLEYDLLHNSIDICEAQSDVNNYKSENGGVQFPFPSLVIPFVPGEYEPGDLAEHQPTKHVSVVRQTLDSAARRVFSLKEPMSEAQVDEMVLFAAQESALAAAGPAGSDSFSRLTKNNNELLRDVSFIEHYRYRFFKLEERGVKPGDKAWEKLGKEVMELLRNFHKQNRWNNPAFRAAARTLAATGNISFPMRPYFGGCMPLDSFQCILASIARRDYKATCGSQVETILHMFNRMLTASDVSDRTQNFVTRNIGKQGKGKSMAQNVVIDLLPEGVAENNTYDTRLYGTAGDTDGDGTGIFKDEDMTGRLKDDGTASNLYKSVRTAGVHRVGRMQKSQASGKQEDGKCVSPLHIAEFINSTKDEIKDPALASRVDEFEADPLLAATEEDLIEAVCMPESKEKIPMRTFVRQIFALVMMFNALTSVEYLPPASTEMLPGVSDGVKKILDEMKAVNTDPRKCTTRVINRAKLQARGLAALKAVLEVTASGLMETEPGYMDLDKTRPTLELFKYMAHHGYADSGVIATTIYSFSRRMCSEEMGMILEEIEKILIQERAAKNLNGIEKKGAWWLALPNTKAKGELEKTLADLTGLDGPRVKAQLDLLEKREVPADKKNYAIYYDGKGNCVRIWAGLLGTDEAAAWGAPSSSSSSSSKADDRTEPFDKMPLTYTKRLTIDLVADYMSTPGTKPHMCVVPAPIRGELPDGRPHLSALLNVIRITPKNHVPAAPLVRPMTSLEREARETILGTGEATEDGTSQPSDSFADAIPQVFTEDFDDYAYEFRCKDFDGEPWEAARTDYVRRLPRPPLRKAEDYPDNEVEEEMRLRLALEKARDDKIAEEKRGPAVMNLPEDAPGHDMRAAAPRLPPPDQKNDDDA